MTRQVPLPQGLTFVAVAVPKCRPAALAYVSAFVEEAKASGLLQKAIDNAGERGMVVAPQDILTATIPGGKH